MKTAAVLLLLQLRLMSYNQLHYSPKVINKKYLDE